MKVCTQCLTDKTEGEYYYKGKKSDGKLASECKVCFNKRMMVRYEQRAAQIVAMKGGECLICGYDECPAALEFHHIDPTQKEFQISKRWSMTDERIKSEIDKCVLLCSNCHRETHWKIDRGEVVDFIGR